MPSLSVISIFLSGANEFFVLLGCYGAFIASYQSPIFKGLAVLDHWKYFFFRSQ